MKSDEHLTRLSLHPSSSPGPEGGMREAADPSVRLGAAEPNPERPVSAARQNVRRRGLPGRNPGVIILPRRQITCSDLSVLRWISSSGLS